MALITDHLGAFHRAKPRVRRPPILNWPRLVGLCVNIGLWALIITAVRFCLAKS